MIASLWPARTNFRPRPGEVRFESDLPYAGPDGDPLQCLDLVSPLDAKGAPLVLFVHGGAWRKQSRRLWRPWSGLYTNVGLALARRGIVTALLGYRQSPATLAVDDVRRAAAWLRAWGSDVGCLDALVLVGHSAGGHLVAWLGTRGGESPAGIVTLGGFGCPSTMAQRMGPSGERLARLYPSDDARQWNVREALGPTTPPWLAMVAERDPVAIRAEHDDLTRAAVVASAPVRASLVPQLGHMGLVLTIGAERDAIGAKVGDFVHEVASDPSPHTRCG